MASSVLDRETLLDLSVNIIPLGILLFFIGLFVVQPGFEYDPFTTTIQMSLLVIPFIGLAILTYVSGKTIAKAEQELEEER